MKKTLLLLAITGLLAGCAGYDAGQGGIAPGYDRMLGTGGTGDTPSRGGADFGPSTNALPPDRNLNDQPNGRLGDAPH